jgi:hypothetical protein
MWLKRWSGRIGRYSPSPCRMRNRSVTGLPATFARRTIRGPGPSPMARLRHAPRRSDGDESGRGRGLADRSASRRRHIQYGELHQGLMQWRRWISATGKKKRWPSPKVAFHAGSLARPRPPPAYRRHRYVNASNGNRGVRYSGSSVPFNPPLAGTGRLRRRSSVWHSWQNHGRHRSCGQLGYWRTESGDHERQPKDSGRSAWYRPSAWSGWL